MLRIENVSWSSPDSREVLHNVNLDIPEGKLIVITEYPLSSSFSFKRASCVALPLPSVPSIVNKYIKYPHKFLNFSLISTILPQVMLPSGHGP